MSYTLLNFPPEIERERRIGNLFAGIEYQQKIVFFQEALFTEMANFFSVDHYALAIARLKH